MKKWLIIYSSVTGNTKQIAKAIYEGFGENIADIFAIQDEFKLENYNNVAVGYWLTRGEPDKMVQELLKKLNNKIVILFQTQGAELNSEHSITAFARAASYLGDNCKVLGTFASQGKINPAILEKRKNIDKNNPHAPTPRNLERWQKASIHPNEEDISRAKDFVKSMQRKIALREKYLNMKK